MSKKTFDYSSLSAGERQRLEAFEAELEAARQRILQEAPEHIQELGPILRRSVESDDLSEFCAFLQEQGMAAGIPLEQLGAFRDLLIVQRIDLKDLEPDARVRLRHRTLAQEDSHLMTEDYHSAVKGGQIPHCRDCRWFVTAPKDGEDNGDKSCVQMGTKGADQACIGFTLPEKKPST